MDKYGLAIYNENRVKKRLSTYLDCGGLASVIFRMMERKVICMQNIPMWDIMMVLRST